MEVLLPGSKWYSSKASGHLKKGFVRLVLAIFIRQTWATTKLQYGVLYPGIHFAVLEISIQLQS